MIIRNFVFFILLLSTASLVTTPINAQAGRVPKSAVCDYNPNEPLVGCWYKVLPKEKGKRVFNVKRDHTWYDGYIANMEDGRPDIVGKSINTYSRSIELISFNQFNPNGKPFTNKFNGPFYFENCSIMELQSAGVYEGFIEGYFGIPQKKYNMTFIRLNTKILTTNLFSNNPPRFNQLYPDKDHLFSTCRTRRIIDAFTLESLVFYGGLATSIALKLVTKTVAKKAGGIVGTNPFWGSRANLTPAQYANEKWLKHGKEFPNIKSEKQYIKVTIKFLEKPPKDTLKIVRQRDNATILYHPKTNTMAIKDVNNIPQTMYKPDPKIHRLKTNLEYFYAQQ